MLFQKWKKYYVMLKSPKVHQKVGKQIREIRKSLKISQEELAKLHGGLTRASVVRMELGYHCISLHHIEIYAKALGVTPKDIMKGIWW